MFNDSLPDSGDTERLSPIKVATRVKRLPPYMFGRINQLLYDKRRAGSDVIDLGMGNPSDPPDARVIEKLGEAARDPRNHGYSQSNGILNLRREVASKYLKRFGVRLDPEQEVMVCLGSKEGFSHMCLAMMGAGDTAITPAPYFPVHMYAVALAAGNVIALEVADSEKFLANIAYTCQHLYPRPKLLILNYPHNPSTVTVEPEFFVEVVRLAKRLRIHGNQRFRLCRRGLRRVSASQFPGRSGGHRRGRGVHHDEQGLQHGWLARGILLRQCGDDSRAWV